MHFKGLLLAGVFVCAGGALAQEVELTQALRADSVLARQVQRDMLYDDMDIDAHDVVKAYVDFKSLLKEKTGISYTIDATMLAQHGAPNGGKNAWQNLYFAGLNWDLFQSDTWGKGSFQFGYTVVRYWNTSATDLGDRVGVVSGINDFTSNASNFNQLTYTQQMGGDLDWLSLTVGQFPMYNFDGTSYSTNQQLYFVNESFTQNLAQGYPLASFGGYASIQASPDLQFNMGLQSANNMDGVALQLNNLGDRYTSFLNANYSPKNKWGDFVVNVLLYNQPSVEAQPENMNGWSLSVQQNIDDKWAVFARVLGVGKNADGVRQSYVVGGVYNNPLNRHKLDQIGLSYGYNKLDKEAIGDEGRAGENVMEAFWSWGLTDFMILTPDIQFYINPGQSRSAHTATITSLRATVMF